MKRNKSTKQVLEALELCHELLFMSDNPDSYKHLNTIQQLIIHIKKGTVEIPLLFFNSISDNYE